MFIKYQRGLAILMQVTFKNKSPLLTLCSVRRSSNERSYISELEIDAWRTKKKAIEQGFFAYLSYEDMAPAHSSVGHGQEKEQCSWQYIDELETLLDYDYIDELSDSKGSLGVFFSPDDKVLLSDTLKQSPEQRMKIEHFVTAPALQVYPPFFILPEPSIVARLQGLLQSYRGASLERLCVARPSALTYHEVKQTFTVLQSAVMYVKAISVCGRRNGEYMAEAKILELIQDSLNDIAGYFLQSHWSERKGLEGKLGQYEALFSQSFYDIPTVLVFLDILVTVHSHLIGLQILQKSDVPLAFLAALSVVRLCKFSDTMHHSEMAEALFLMLRYVYELAADSKRSYQRSHEEAWMISELSRSAKESITSFIDALLDSLCRKEADFDKMGCSDLLVLARIQRQLAPGDSIYPILKRITQKWDAFIQKRGGLRDNRAPVRLSKNMSFFSDMPLPSRITIFYELMLSDKDERTSSIDSDMLNMALTLCHYSLEYFTGKDLHYVFFMSARILEQAQGGASMPGVLHKTTAYLAAKIAGDEGDKTFTLGDGSQSVCLIPQTLFGERHAFSSDSSRKFGSLLFLISKFPCECYRILFKVYVHEFLRDIVSST